VRLLQKDAIAGHDSLVERKPRLGTVGSLLPIQSLVAGHHLHQAARARKRSAHRRENRKGAAHTTFNLPIEGNDQVRLWGQFQHPLAFFVLSREC
jgi:hypothetical protein